MARPKRSESPATRQWGDVVVPLLSAVAVAISFLASTFPSSMSVWMRLVLRPLLGVSLSSVQGSDVALDLLRILGPWLGAALLAWTILRAEQGRQGEHTGKMARSGWVVASAVALAGCAASLSAAETSRAVSAAPAWPYVHASLSALFGAVFAAWAISRRRAAARWRAAAVGAGICVATYALLPLGLLLLAVWCSALGVSSLLGRPPSPA